MSDAEVIETLRELFKDMSQDERDIHLEYIRKALEGGTKC